ncbi:Rieske (2Fe-2S) protein [Streptomyces leeuwenhoekii]|uniref:Iron-sulfur protein n=1 Tax=Streptomyces leeuwenhoekii TaxID=1437453 RepID=A0A0F7VYL4_STRLW|nr:Rieske (2Fe-2S) protein [Streptomyces leeuwenhoekii]KMS71502.1 iron-sulfur protein [Streptomyces leeuwenhoekii]CQR64825.1 Rieske Domain-Containing Protein [Streptomyces leeuwenhoekii]
MTHPPARRTVLLATGAAALLAGCGDSGGTSGEASAGASPGRELAKTSDVPVGGGVVLKDEQVVVTQPEEGDFRAFSAICTHQRCPVAAVEAGTINCTCHGSRFRITDGSVASPPATRALPERKITVEGNSIRLA